MSNTKRRRILPVRLEINLLAENDTGTPYLIFESRPSKGFNIASLSDDYLNVEKEISFMNALLEDGAIVHYKGLYYANLFAA